MIINKRNASIFILAGLLLGSLLAGAAFTGKPSRVAAAPVQQTQPVDAPTAEDPAAEDGDTTQDPSYTGSILVDEAQTDGMSEADEAAALQGQATISAEEAQAAAEAANPGAKAVKVELDNENGVLVYSVELDNGLDVKIDAGNASVLHTEQAGDDTAEEANEAGDSDNVQEEHEAQNEADDATEGPEAPEDAPAAPEAAPAP